MKLKYPEKFTVHLFGKTLSTLMTNTGVDVLVLKRYNGWKSRTITRSYMVESISNKNKVANQILYNKVTPEQALCGTSTSTLVENVTSQEILYDSSKLTLTEQGIANYSENNIKIKQKHKKTFFNFLSNVNNCLQ